MLRIANTPFLNDFLAFYGNLHGNFSGDTPRKYLQEFDYNVSCEYRRAFLNARARAAPYTQRSIKAMKSTADAHLATLKTIVSMSLTRKGSRPVAPTTPVPKDVNSKSYIKNSDYNRRCKEVVTLYRDLRELG